MGLTIGVESGPSDTPLDLGPNRRRTSEIEAQTLHEIESLNRDLDGTGTCNKILINNVFYISKIIVRFNDFSPRNNSLKRVLVVAPEQPQCRF